MICRMLRCGPIFHFSYIMALNRITNRLVLTLFVLCLSACEKRTEMPYADVNMTKLVSECLELVKLGTKENRDTWLPPDPLPPTISSLSPQIVKVVNSAGSIVVDIQLLGG